MVAVTAPVVKVAQNASASDLDAVYAAAQASLAGLSQPKARGRRVSKSALRILEKRMYEKE